MSLSPVLSMLTQIANESSTKKKSELIKQFAVDPLFCKVVYCALNPFLVYKTRNINFVDAAKPRTEIRPIFDYLDYLAGKPGCSAAENEVLALRSSIDVDTVEVVNRILKKDLRCGADTKLFSAHVEFPVHKVMLCHDDLDKFIKAAKTAKNACWSIKLDGVRCWAVVTPDRVTYVSRNGKEFKNFSKFDLVLKDAAHVLRMTEGFTYPIIFDGEVVSKSRNFQEQMTQVRRINDADPGMFEFEVYDVVCKRPFRERYDLIVGLFTGWPSIHYVEHVTLDELTPEYITELIDSACDKGEEGIVCKTWDGPYEYKRSNLWFKGKRFITEEFKVFGWFKGQGKYEGMLGGLVVEDENGILSEVGTGFTDDERRKMMDRLPDMIEVRYQEKMESGKLRFPARKRPADATKEFYRERDDK